jgi:hypothetical protein
MNTSPVNLDSDFIFMFPWLCAVSRE